MSAPVTDEAVALEIPDRVPCATCRVPVDPVRAPQVAVVEERYRFYCSRECRERGRPAPRRPRTHARGPQHERPSLAETLRLLAIPLGSIPPALLDEDAGPRSVDAEAVAPARGRDESVDPVPPGVAACAAVFALLVASLTSLPLAARTITLFAAALAVLTVSGRELWLRRNERASLAWAASLAGALLPFVDALRSSGERVPSSLRETAVLAAVGPVAAWFFGARRAEAIARVTLLQSALPLSARVAGKDGAAPETVDAARLRAGAEVIVEHGAAVPVDGVVRDGEAQVRLWPGARELRTRRAGDAVLAGAQVLDGRIRVLATRAGAEVSWARLARMMTVAVAAPRVVTLARLFGARAPFVAVGLAIVAGVVHALWTSGDGLLAAACVLALTPCAVAAPAAESPFADALVAAARRGIVFRDAASVESAARVGTVALCLRGTVTHGRMELTEVVSLGSRPDAELIATAAAVEEVDAGDPIARALAEAVAKRGLRLQNIRRPALLPGHGVTAVSAAGDPVLVGNRRLLLAEGVSVAPAEETAAAIEGAGRTAVFVAIDGRVEAVLGFEDAVRDEVRSAVQAMIDAGYDVALLGGASRATVEAIGAMLDVANLRPEVLPDEGAAVVRALAEVGHGAAVVGRPGRDGAVLAAADVAISVDAAGGAGTDTAMALASDDLRDAAAALRMARRARERSLAAFAVGAVGTAAGAVVSMALPSWGLTTVALTLAGVLAGQALVLRDPEREDA
jgi:cation transport ATPase